MSGETAIEERPGAVEWASLKPGDLAWDAGDGDLVVALEGDAARRTALVAEAVGRLRAAESSRAALLRIVDQTAEEPASLSAIRRAVAEVEPDGMRREAAERALVALLGEGSP